MKFGSAFLGSVGDIIDRAGVGSGSWKDIAAAVSEALPGSFCGFNSQNKRTGEVNFGVLAGFSDDAARLYAEYYCKVNPLNYCWKIIKPGDIVESEKVIPISAIINTEFYADFFSRYGDYRIGLGVKIAEDENDELVMPLHFASSVRDAYEPIVRELLTTMAPSLNRAGELNRHFSQVVNLALRLGALSAHSTEFAFVVDRGMQLVEATAPAQTLLETPLFGVRSGKLTLGDSKGQAWLESSLKGMMASRRDYNSRFHLADDDVRWTLHLAALPGRNQHGLADLFGLTRYALLVARKVGASFASESIEFIRMQFGLTAAEIRVALSLVAGNDVASISSQLGLSRETVRSHVKSILAKTRTNRQAELVALMLQFH